MNILIEAAKRAGMTYRIEPPPDGVNNVDCSLYVLLTFRDAGAPFPAGIRTAQQIRQACTPIDYGAVQPGDLVFFEHTYEPDERPGPDGRLASHLGISLGTGTQKMWDANEVNGVGITSIATKYWQDRIFMAGRPKQVMADQPPPAPPKTKQIRAVDVSSHQTPSLPALQQWISIGCQLLIVKSYQQAEGSLKQSTRDHVANARAAGCWTLPYVWLYRSVDPRESVRTSLELFRSTGEKPGIMFLDCETYGNPDGSIDPGPSVNQILAAEGECRAMGVAPALYSGAWWLQGHLEGDKSKLVGMPAWLADYSKPPSLDWQAPYGLKLIGHQYQGSPLDWSLMDLQALEELAGPVEPGEPSSPLKDAILRELDVIHQAHQRIAELVAHE